MPVDMEMVIALAFSFLMTLVVVITIGGVILLRPISKHLGQYLEAKANERKALGQRAPEDWDRLFATLEGLAARMDSMEERQEFTERLLAKPGKDDSGG
jgi:hypothetical protein